MNKILIPAASAEQWAQFLAEPTKHWRRGYSARTLAYCWQEADGFPREVKDMFSATSLFPNIEMLLAIPEHQVPLPGGSRPSQNDIWVLGRTECDLVSITIEGKVSEPFGPTMEEWLADASTGKSKRLAFLCKMLGLSSHVPTGLRYQLLHRMVSAVIEAKRFTAAHAVMIIHSFGQADEWFQDYYDFVSLFGAASSINQLVSIGECDGISLHCAWVRGNEIYLSK